MIIAKPKYVQEGQEQHPAGDSFTKSGRSVSDHKSGIRDIYCLSLHQENESIDEYSLRGSYLKKVFCSILKDY